MKAGKAHQVPLSDAATPHGFRSSFRDWAAEMTTFPREAAFTERRVWDCYFCTHDNSTVDDRTDYGEVRMIGYAYIGTRLFCVVYTDRGDQRRVISLRKANSKEIKRYAAT